MSLCLAEEAQADGVDVLTAEDDHTGVNFLHRQVCHILQKICKMISLFKLKYRADFSLKRNACFQTIFDHADSCQKLIEMGMDPNKALSAYFENGDGGYSSYVRSFTCE